VWGVQVVEEFMSIADGQVVLQREAGSGRVSVDPQASVSRIGSRAYPPALADLAVQLRFELAQVIYRSSCPQQLALMTSFCQRALPRMLQCPGILGTKMS
jgi:F0F1-type ATP synthase alpha subunit